MGRLRKLLRPILGHYLVERVVQLVIILVENLPLLFFLAVRQYLLLDGRLHHGVVLATLCPTLDGDRLAQILLHRRHQTTRSISHLFFDTLLILLEDYRLQLSLGCLTLVPFGLARQPLFEDGHLLLALLVLRFRPILALLLGSLLLVV